MNPLSPPALVALEQLLATDPRPLARSTPAITRTNADELVDHAIAYGRFDQAAQIRAEADSRISKIYAAGCLRVRQAK